MATVAVYNMEGAKTGTMEVSDAVFAAEVNKAVLHSVVVNDLANQRQGTQNTKTRTEVAGGGIKPWRQKGTGRARQGSIRAPQWTGGGVALGPKPRDYRVTLNKKTRRAALASALSAKVAEGSLVVVDSVKLDAYKTSEMVKMFAALGLTKEVTKKYKENNEVKTRTAKVAEKTLLVLPEVDKLVVKSCDNIPTAVTTLYSTLSVYDILNAEKLVMTREAVEKLEEVYA